MEHRADYQAVLDDRAYLAQDDAPPGKIFCYDRRQVCGVEGPLTNGGKSYRLMLTGGHIVIVNRLVAEEAARIIEARNDALVPDLPL